ncbi:MAG: protoheme IX farnesyltransferase [Pirellulales bacterium]|nr:protoheme IX farnesyltransferase [Pirellulales bacterium]
MSRVYSDQRVLTYPVRAYLRLVRPGLLATMLLAMAIAALTAGQHLPPLPQLIHAVLGTALLIMGASAMNQVVEQNEDAKMPRTATRPLPSRLLTKRQVTALAILLSIAGTAYLAVLSTPTLTLLAVSSWIVYVLAYTPLKRKSVWQTPVGSLAGAIPVLLGSAMVGAVFSPISLSLFGVVFFWQFPHTSSIGWIYREQYAQAGIKVAAVVDPTGRLAGRLAVFGAACVLPLSLVPAIYSTTGWICGLIALILGLADLAVAAKFLRKPSNETARLLRRMSLVHLPVLLLSIFLAVRF